jgi:hypothetical protein
LLLPLDYRGGNSYALRFFRQQLPQFGEKIQFARIINAVEFSDSMALWTRILFDSGLFQKRFITIASIEIAVFVTVGIKIKPEARTLSQRDVC